MYTVFFINIRSSVYINNFYFYNNSMFDLILCKLSAFAATSAGILLQNIIFIFTIKLPLLFYFFNVCTSFIMILYYFILNRLTYRHIVSFFYVYDTVVDENLSFNTINKILLKKKNFKCFRIECVCLNIG